MANQAAKPKSGPARRGELPPAAVLSRQGECCCASGSCGAASRRGGIHALAHRLDAVLRRLGKALSRDEAAPCCDGLTPAQCRTLETLCLCPGCTCATLAEQTGVSASTLTRHVDPLVSAGFVERVEGGDRRVIRLCCTGRGADVAAKIRSRKIGFLEDVLGMIPSDRRKNVVDALEELISAFEKSEGGTCC